MELLQIPTHRKDKNGQLIPINVDPAKLLVHHMLLMTEGDWYNQWEMPPKKRSIKVNRALLDDPLINDIFFCYQQEVDAHKELGTPIVNPNPKDAICGYIYNCYSYPEGNDEDIFVPPGFVIEEPDNILKKRLRRIEQKVDDRALHNKKTQKDEMFEQFQLHLISKGVEVNSKEYVEKSIEYWEEMGRMKNPVEGVPPSQSSEIILTTNKRKYNRKALRARFRYLYEKEMEYCLAWVMQHPLTDMSTYEGKMALVTDYDNEEVNNDTNNG